MSENPPPSHLHFFMQIFIVFLILIVAGIAGLWVGSLLGPSAGLPPKKTKTAEEKQRAGEGKFRRDPNAPPLFFFPGNGLNENSRPVADELAMAAKAGIHQYVVPVANMVPWQGEQTFKSVLDTVSRVLRNDTDATFLFQVDLNPTKEWLSAHGHGCAQKDPTGKVFPSVACPLWTEECKKALAGLAKGVQGSPLAQHTLGYVLSALTDGHWVQPEGYDRSEVNRDGFRHWLQGRYVKEAALIEAWGGPARFSTVEIPERPESGDSSNVFLSLPTMRSVADFQEYTSQSVADTIASFGTALRAAAGKDAEILAPYGFSFELTRNDAGHCALGLLLNGDISGFVSPVSYIDRGVGGVGAPMDPIHSALDRGKKWYIIDDTRTGMAWNPQTLAPERIKGLRAEDVFNVQRRNFCQAAVFGLGLIWADPNGEGWLQDEEQWKVFAQMQRIYAFLKAVPSSAGSSFPIPTGPLSVPTTVPPGAVQTGKGGPAEGEAAPEGEGGPGVVPDADGEAVVARDSGNEEISAADGESPVPLVTASEAQAALTVVVDETSRYYQQCDTPLNTLVIRQALDACLRSGVATRFCLLQDILDGKGESTTVYLFLNAFRLTGEERGKLHARMRDEHACAIWVYAPGYLDKGFSVENISATTGMTVMQFPDAQHAGSVFALPGRWMRQEAKFGDSGLWKPLFYIEDKNTDTMSRYAATSKVSMAMRVLEEGWTSVYLADPGLSPALLSEILSMMDQHLFFQPGESDFYDSACVVDHGDQGRLLAIHARQTGERTIGLNGFYHVQDLFDPNNVGRPKESFLLPMRNGETHLYKLTPLQ